MSWRNGPLIVYHGTDDRAANTIRLSGLNPSKFRGKSDFGEGFYVTTVLHQAQQWANQCCRRTGRNAEVLQYDLSRDRLETLKHLTFVVDSQDYYEFVAFCRSGGPNHGPSPRIQPYEVIYGPVSLGRQKLVIGSCDQILFSNPKALREFDNPSRSHSPAGRNRFF